MSDTFLNLCSSVLLATKFISNYEKCCPHYQRALDYITAHLDERACMVKIIAQFVIDGGYTEISLVQFLMETLKWSEIREVAETRCAQEGNMYSEVKHLVDIYKTMA